MFRRTKLAVVIHAGRITKDRRCYICGLVSVMDKLPPISVSALGYSDRERGPSSAHSLGQSGPSLV